MDLTSSTLWAAVGSLGTLLAFVVAFWQIQTERTARKRDAADRLIAQERAQAVLVAAWFVNHSPQGHVVASGFRSVHVRNASSEPVYRVVAWPVFVQGAGPTTGEDSAKNEVLRPDFLAILPPGDYYAEVGGWSPGMYSKPGVELEFTDAAGCHWVRRASGQLLKIATEAVQFYGLPEPVDWKSAATPIRAIDR